MAAELPQLMDLHELHPTRTDRRTGGAFEPVAVAASGWRRSALWWSLLALLAGLALAFAAHLQQQRRHLTEQSLVRGEMAGKTYAALLNRLHESESLLRAVQTLFLSSDEVSETEFTNFYDNMRPHVQFPGLLALAYAQRESGPQGEHFITSWVQPRKGNEAVVGLDVAAQPSNLAGLLASRDSGEVALSAPFRPVQQTGAGAPDGFTMRLPVFSPGDPPRTMAQRRERMRGSIAVSFRISKLLGNVLQPDVGRQLRLTLHDVTDPARAVPMFDSAPAAATGDDFRFERRLAYGGRVLDVVMRSRPMRPTAFDWSQSALPVGVLASVLLAMLVFSVVSTRQRALELGWQMSRRYRESEERFRALNDLLPALVLLAEVGNGRITYANQAARDRLGADVGERNLPDLFEDRDLRTRLSAPDTRGCGRLEAQLRLGEASSFWASVAISRVVLTGHDKLLMVANDISEQRQLTELLSHQASHDALTELYNRREFERRLQAALALTDGSSPAAMLLYLDLDQFKLINDTSGHLAGDQLLAQ